MKISLVKVYVYGDELLGCDGYTAFLDKGTAEEWLDAGGFRRLVPDGDRYENHGIYAEVIETEVV